MVSKSRHAGHAVVVLVVVGGALFACRTGEAPATTLLGATADAGTVQPADAGAPERPTRPTVDEALLALDAGAAITFEEHVYPLLVWYCGECHSVNGPYHDAASADIELAYSDSVEFAERLVARIRLGNMPPECVFDEAACVSATELAYIERWIEDGLLR